MIPGNLFLFMEYPRVSSIDDVIKNWGNFDHQMLGRFFPLALHVVSFGLTWKISLKVPKSQWLC